MIRVSIDLPDGYKYRLKAIVDSAELALEQGVLVGFNLPNPDLRVLHQLTAAEELKASGDGRLNTPIIVYERTDAAGVSNYQDIRDLMEHPDVKFWLKRNAFRDYRLNNENYLTGRLHYKMLNNMPKFHVGDTVGEEIRRPVTAEMAAKIRPLPVAPIDLFAPLRAVTIDWNAKRDIDVTFLGHVDYAQIGPDGWDDAFDKNQAAALEGFPSLIDLHRREAIRQLVNMKHLRILVGMNGAVRSELYHPAMLRSSIGISPWGLGEYSYRDYETILAGSVLVKPNSNHIATFAPDIYQENKYYVPCALDFSDLPEVIRSIMSNRARSIEIARSAREALLEANAPRQIVEYFVGMFNEALGIAKAKQAIPFPSVAPTRPPVLEIGKGDVGAARGTLEVRNEPVPALGIERTLVFREEATERNSHDIRVTARSLVGPGLYRVRCILRPIGRRFAAVEVHHSWDDSCSFHVNLGNGEVAGVTKKGSGFELVGIPKVRAGADGWQAISAFVRVDRIIPEYFMIVLYAGDEIDSYYYAGVGAECFEIAAFDIDKVDDFVG